MFFASLILLVHAVVPHHHHDDFACFIYSEESGHDDCCDHEDADHQKKHDTDSTNDCCVLNDMLAVIPDTYKQEDLHFDFSWMPNSASYLISMIVVPDIYLEQVFSYKDFRQRPFLVNSYEVYAPHSLGLRAPPYC